MRALGPCLPGDQRCAGEFKRRCEAAQLAHRQCGCFWPSDSTDKLHKLMKKMFRAFVSRSDPSVLAAL
eukprot:8486727-Pyramimonas_sp.AAC.1